MSNTIQSKGLATTPLSTDDILAIVQGGVLKRTTVGDLPDGATIISNANGIAIRFVGGFQVCFLETLQSHLAGNPAVGTYSYEWTFPAAFSNTINYVVGGLIQTASPTDGLRARILGTARRESRTASACNVFYQVETLTSASVRIGAFAIGSWSA